MPRTTTDRSDERHAETAGSVESHIGSPTPSLLVLFPRPSRTDKTVVPQGRGWLLGTYRRRYNDGGSSSGEEVDGEAMTVLLDQSEISYESYTDRQFARVVAG